MKLPGDMDGQLRGGAGVWRSSRRSSTFPYSNWGPWAAVLGVLLALGTGIVLSVPALIIDNRPAAGT